MGDLRRTYWIRRKMQGWKRVMRQARQTFFFCPSARCALDNATRASQLQFITFRSRNRYHTPLRVAWQSNKKELHTVEGEESHLRRVELVLLSGH